MEGRYDTKHGLGTTEAGRAILPLHGSAKNIYCSATGSDSNNGLTEGTPKLTPGAAVALVTDGAGDHVLFKRGDTFADGLGTWTKSGKNSYFPMLIGCYGDIEQPRPVLAAGPSATALFIAGIGGGGIENYIAIVDIVANKGFDWQKRNAYFLLEHCKFVKSGVSFQNRKDVADQRHYGRNFTMRFCSSGENKNIADRAQALYMYNQRGAVIEDCCFYRGGWEQSRQGDVADAFSHNVYLDYHNHSDTIYRRNISAQASSHGLQLRAGGLCYDNVFIDNPIGIIFGYGTDDIRDYYPRGVLCKGWNNVIIGSEKIREGLTGGLGIQIENQKEGSFFKYNLVTHDDQSGRGRDFFNNQVARAKGYSGSPDLYVRNFDFSNNITFDWSRFGNIQKTGVTALVTTRVQANEWDTSPSGTNVDSALETYTASGRDVKSYNADVLGDDWSVEQFMHNARDNRMDRRYSAEVLRNYLFAGYDLAPRGIQPTYGPE